MAFIITIVGMGLMGGSFAMALRGFRDAHIIGVNRSEGPIREALDAGVIDEGYVLSDFTAKKALSHCDLCIVCLYPEHMLELFETYGTLFKSGAVVTDVAGVKTPVIDKARALLPEHVDFVGAHPMAGREVSGYSAAIATLFNGANYVITPTSWNKTASVALIRELALYIGAGRVTMADSLHHDKMIAYTSQMAHVIAAAIVKSNHLLESKGFEGGSFRDCTRVATLNETMWSELFALNRDALSPVLDELIGGLGALNELIKKGDREGLRMSLAESSRRKEEWNKWDVSK